MIRVSDIKLSLEQVANAKELLITDIREIREYVDGKRTDNIIGCLLYTSFNTAYALLTVCMLIPISSASCLTDGRLSPS